MRLASNSLKVLQTMLILPSTFLKMWPKPACGVVDWLKPRAGPGCKEQLAHGCYATARASETRTHDLANASRARYRLSRHPIIVHISIFNACSLWTGRSDLLRWYAGKTFCRPIAERIAQSGAVVWRMWRSQVSLRRMQLM